MYYSEYYDFNLTNLIQGLRNVEILSSNVEDTIGMFYEFNEAVPLFDKLLHLSIRTNEEICWIGLEYLLENSPHLKHITIDGFLHYNALDPESVCDCLCDYSFLLLSPIEVLRINHFGGEYSGELVQIREMLKNLPSLVLLEVYVEPTTYDKKQKIMNDLLRLLPKDLSHCTVQVESS
ncbi:putative F-box/LRR-repeat protein [Cardamine amara subsp. amara]|uniref:F-box/LRR-repeat protein n=1 Tax=Cardamine amara subsp. amara TaxID=228776 RepID=A0ABD1BIP1_CARAN